jgi:hypothetical protein
MGANRTAARTLLQWTFPVAEKLAARPRGRIRRYTVLLRGARGTGWTVRRLFQQESFYSSVVGSQALQTIEVQCRSNGSITLE